MMSWRFCGKYDLMNELMNYEAVCRPALATPGLFNIQLAVYVLDIKKK